MSQVYDGLSPETTDPNDIEDDYDPTQTSEYQGGFEDGVEEERERWLPLWEAVKELEEGYSRFGVINNTAWYRLNLVIITLRSSGEK